MNQYLKKTVLIAALVTLATVPIAKPWLSTKDFSRAFTIDCESSLVKRTCHVVFSNSIIGISHYRKLLKLLRDSDKMDEITLHLAGNGGLVSTTKILASAIKDSKARIITSADGNVYSAHAFLTLMGDEIRIHDHVLLLFHRSSLYGNVDRICTNKSGTDRTISKKEKCFTVLNKILKTDFKFLESLAQKVLTPKELSAMRKGHDIVVSGFEINKRLGRGGKK